MGKQALSGRNNWQTKAVKQGSEAETAFLKAFKTYFKNSDFEIISKPKDFKHIYENFILPPEIDKRIYHPKDKDGNTLKYQHGFTPDYAITNRKTIKTIYVEVKRQDGWIENKKPNAGRGNVHERSCKYFTPGLIEIMRKQGNITDILPFWIVFIGDITRDPKRTREIHLWYKDCNANFFLWDNLKDPARLLEHFKKHLQKFLL